MSSIISLFITFFNFLNKLSFHCSNFLKSFLSNYHDKKLFSKDFHLYRTFDVDPIPIIKPEHLPISFDQAKAIYQAKHNKPLTPISRRTNSSPIDPSLSCPHCSASHDYLYDNTGLHSSFLCKVCGNTFSINKSYIEQLAHYCPFCGTKLSIHKRREHFLIFKCLSYNCKFYKNNLKALSKSQKKKYKLNPSAFKLHYITRIFDASLDDLENLQHRLIPSKVSLNRIHNSSYVLGLILTYYINYSLSLRKTALILKEVHDISISHQTIANYAQAASNLLNCWLDDFQYDTLSNDHCGDETYVKIKGKNAYVFFMCDSIKKIITSFNIFEKRDTFAAIQTFYSVFRKFKVIPQDLKVIVDGNPIYKVAQQYFQLKGITFNLTQVIGLKNTDDISKKYRPHKQIIERLNRTFKFSYYVKNGFSTLEQANSFMCLFTTYFNFLRNHRSLNHKPPVELDELNDLTNMPTKWNVLLTLAQEHLSNLDLIEQ